MHNKQQFIRIVIAVIWLTTTGSSVQTWHINENRIATWWSNYRDIAHWLMHAGSFVYPEGCMSYSGKRLWRCIYFKLCGFSLKRQNRMTNCLADFKWTRMSYHKPPFFNYLASSKRFCRMQHAKYSSWNFWIPLIN